MSVLRAQLSLVALRRARHLTEARAHTLRSSLIAALSSFALSASRALVALDKSSNLPLGVAPAADAVGEATYLDCQRHENARVKALGAHWDCTQKRWYVPAGLSLQPFRAYLRPRGASLDATGFGSMP